MEKICSNCHKRFEAKDGRVKKCDQCRKEDKQPEGKYFAKSSEEMKEKMKNFQQQYVEYMKRKKREKIILCSAIVVYLITVLTLLIMNLVK